MTTELKKKLLVAAVVVAVVLLGCGIFAVSSFGALLMYVVSFVLGVGATKAVQKALSLKEESTE